MTRTTVAVVLAALLVLAPIATTAQTASDLQADVGVEQVGPIDVILNRVPTDVIRYGAGGHPSVIVSIDEANSSDDLESWENGSDDRDIRSWIDDRTAVVSAPLGDLAGGLFSTGLDELEYVEDLDYNYRVELVEPVTLKNESKVEVPRRVRFAGAISSIRRGDSFDRDDGVAYANETNETLPVDVRDRIGADNVSIDASNVTIAVLDTGLNYRNTLYSDRVVAGKNFVDNETINTSDSNYTAIEDGNGHGSWVAGIIAADASNDSYDGVVPNASLAIGKVLSDDGSGSTADIVEGIRWAIDQDVDVISMSLGSPVYSEALAKAVRNATDHDIVVVIAAGNSRYVTGIGPGSPADTPGQGVLTVAAANAPETISNAEVAYFSEVGPDTGADSRGVTAGESPDIAAPGMDVVAAVETDGGVRDNESLSGTSMATPIVAASVAAVIAEDGDSTAAELVDRITDHSRVMPRSGSTEVGYGYVAVDRAIEGTRPDETQESARDRPAIIRDATHRSLSSSEVFGLL